MSLTSYRAAPPRGHCMGEDAAIAAALQVICRYFLSGLAYFGAGKENVSRIWFIYSS